MEWEDRLLRVEGFVELQMYAEANRELRLIGAAHRRKERVLFLKYQIFAGLGKWKAAELATEHLTRRYPARPMYWLAGAACARQLGSLDEAQAILETARHLHPENGPIWYALAVCASVSGRLEEARLWISRAIEHEPRLHQRFLGDLALKPIWSASVDVPETSL
jgi:tetratricopeptide (TPR) repeat protein